MSADILLFTYFGFFTGIIVGYIVAHLQRHPTRRGVWVPIATALLVSGCIVTITHGYGWWLGVLLGISFAVAVSGLVGKAIGPAAVCAVVAVLLMMANSLPTLTSLLAMAVVSVGLLVVTLWSYRRPIGETLGEWPIRMMYRMRASG